MREEEILSGPVLLFASCDAILLSRQLKEKLTQERAVALMNSGVQLVSAERIVEKTSLARLPWKPIAADSFDGWIAPASPLPRPQFLDPHLSDAHVLQVRARATPRTNMMIILVPLASLVVLMLARGLFRRLAVIFLGAAVALTGLSFVAIATIRAAGPPATLAVAWSTRLPEDASNSPGLLTVARSYTACSPLFSHTVRASADPSAMLFPEAATPRQYFSLDDARLSLDVISPNGLDRESTLEIPLPPRGFILYSSSSASLVPAVLPFAMDPAHGVWIEGGQVLAGPPTAPSAVENQVILTQWAAEHPGLKDSLLAWYNLGMNASHRYFLQLPGPADPIGRAGLVFIDLGVPPPASRP